MGDVIYTEPVYTERAPNIAIIEDDWTRWARDHVRRELDRFADEVVGDALKEVMDEERAANAAVVADLRAQIREVELKLAEARGAVGVLRAGKSLSVKGTYDPGARYELNDVIALDGSSFVATEDNPGPCPGRGWQLLAKAGSRGARGFSGPRGERGDAATAAPGFKGFHVDSKSYVLSFIMSDGQVHAMPLRGLFEQFVWICGEIREWIPTR